VTTRRTVRAATLTRDAADIPPELSDVEAACWRTHPETLAWCKAHSVDLAPAWLAERHTPASRLLAVIPAYAIARGHTRRASTQALDATWLTASGLHRVMAACQRAVIADITAERRRTAP